ncbi:MAG: hypothetical protein PHS73_03620 [Candidatus Peribacteraceae bacterium]|nr:hypothetical protein [Candidatus Peribacteraceae bacterium]
MHIARVSTIVGWIFGVVFLLIGVLNALLVHPVPGVFYVLLSFVYLPPASVFLKKQLHLSIPLVVQIIVGFVIMWGTLAVGDLAEMFGL